MKRAVLPLLAVEKKEVVFAVQLLARAVGRALNRRAPGAALYLTDVEVVQCQSVTALWQQGLNFWQVENSLNQLIKFTLAHVFNRWGDVLNHRALNN